MFLGMRSDTGIADRERDEIVTTFCETVTPRHTKRIRRTRVVDTNDVGEAMASASERKLPPGGNCSGAGATLVLLIATCLGTACNDDARRSEAPIESPTHGPEVADPATNITTELDGLAPEFGDAIVAELSGDDSSARTAFEKVLAAPDVPAPIAARSALHLAQLEARANKSRRALDLVARAAALAPGDPAITEGVAQVQADVVAASGTGDLRGPKPGTTLPGVDAKVADAFAVAERSLARVHAIQPRQRLEVWAKEDATEDAVAKYRAIAEHGGLAQIAADYRIGSLYHDLALGLLFERVAELRGRALAYLKSAAASYRASLAGPQLAEAELWRLAAETDLRNARDVLAAAGAGD